MKLAAIGECMLELSVAYQPLYKLGFGGDTLNTAVYLSRCGGTVDFITAMGCDQLSEQMIEAWQQEGVGTSLVKRTPNGTPGLYMIHTDQSGERSFSYWRQNTPARTLIEDWPDIFHYLLTYSYIYLSGITLSLYSDAALEKLWEFLDTFREYSGRVVFDINYRKNNWSSSTRALDVITKMLQRTDIALPSFDDEKQLYGMHTLQECLQRYVLAGVQEIVIKDGINGCLLYADGTCSNIPVPTKIAPIDTTAAGDSFNGAYLAARLQKKHPRDAVSAGQACAALVIQHNGAIIPRHLHASIQEGEHSEA